MSSIENRNGLRCSHCGSHNVTTSTMPSGGGILGGVIGALSKLGAPSNRMLQGRVYIHCKDCGKTSMLQVL